MRKNINICYYWLIFGLTLLVNYCFAEDATNVVFKYKMATGRVGQSMQLQVNTLPEGAIDGLTWSSSNSKVAIVDSTGKLTIPSGSTGSCTITVTCKNGNSSSLIFDAAEELPKVNVTIPIDYRYMNGNAVAGATEAWSDVVSDGLFEGSFCFFADNRSGFSKKYKWYKTSSRDSNSYTFETVSDNTSSSSGSSSSWWSSLFGFNTTAGNNRGSGSSSSSSSSKSTTYTAYGFTNRLDVIDSANDNTLIPFEFDGYQSYEKAFDGYDCVKFSKENANITANVMTTNYYSKWYVLGTGGGTGTGTYGVMHIAVRYSDGTFDSREFKVYDWVDNKNDDEYSVSTKPQYRTGNAADDSGFGTTIGHDKWDGAAGNTPPFCGYYLHAMSFDTDPTKFVVEMEMSLTDISNNEVNKGYYVALFASAGKTGGWFMMPKTELNSVEIKSVEDLQKAATTLNGDWASVAGANGYYIELASEPNFITNSVVYAITVGDINSMTFTNLNPETTYYLRVRAIFDSDDGVIRNSNVSTATTGKMYANSKIPIPYNWIKEQYGLTNDNENEVIETLAKSCGSNGIPNTINYVLGVDPLDPTAKLLLDIEDSMTEKDENGEAVSLIKTVIPGVLEKRPDPSVANYTIQHNLLIGHNLKENFIDAGEFFNTTSIVQNANYTNQTFWKAHTKVTLEMLPKTDFPFDPISEECDSANIVGLTRVFGRTQEVNYVNCPSDPHLLPCVISYDTPTWYIRNSTPSNCVGKGNLELGDEIWVWDYDCHPDDDSADGAYRIFVLAYDDNNNLEWQAAATCPRFNVINPRYEVEDGKEAENFELHRGYGFWLNRTNYLKATHLIGQVPYKGAPDAIVKLHYRQNTLMGNPNFTEFKIVKGQAEKDCFKDYFNKRIRDTFQVYNHNEYSSYMYQYRSVFGGWCRYENEVIDGKKYLMVRKNVSVVLGQAFYYARCRYPEFEINWSRELDENWKETAGEYIEDIVGENEY